MVGAHNDFHSWWNWIPSQHIHLSRNTVNNREWRQEAQALFNNPFQQRQLIQLLNTWNIAIQKTEFVHNICVDFRVLRRARISVHVTA